MGNIPPFVASPQVGKAPDHMHSINPFEGMSYTSNYVIPFLGQFWGCGGDINVTGLDPLGEKPENTHTAYNGLRGRPRPRTRAHPRGHQCRDWLHPSVVVSELDYFQYLIPLAQFRELT